MSFTVIDETKINPEYVECRFEDILNFTRNFWGALMRKDMRKYKKQIRLLDEIMTKVEIFLNQNSVF